MVTGLGAEGMTPMVLAVWVWAGHQREAIITALGLREVRRRQPPRGREEG